MKKRLPGFTLLELLFAIIVLGVMLSVVLTIIIGMLRFYTFSNNIRENQQNGRNVLDTMTREVRFGKLILPSTGEPEGDVLCVADEKNKKLIVYRYDTATAQLLRSQYTYINQELTAEIMECNGSGGVSTDSLNAQVTPERMTVTGFNLQRTAGAVGTGSEKATGVIINLNYGTGSVNASGECEPGDIYCSVLSFQTAVNNRGGGAQ